MYSVPSPSAASTCAMGYRYTTSPKASRTTCMTHLQLTSWYWMFGELRLDGGWQSEASGGSHGKRHEDTEMRQAPSSRALFVYMYGSMRFEVVSILRLDSVAQHHIQCRSLLHHTAMCPHSSFSLHLCVEMSAICRYVSMLWTSRRYFTSGDHFQTTANFKLQCMMRQFAYLARGCARKRHGCARETLQESFGPPRFLERQRV